MRSFRTQIAIVGGGVSGLWLLNTLSSAGFAVILIEKGELGSAQTLASQGMIHGGIKYALGGFTTPSSETIASMPDRWRDCIAGKSVPDLTGVQLLSSDYYLFSDTSISSRVTAFFGSRAIRGRVEPMRREDYPGVFANEQFKGMLYRLQDIVVDTTSLVSALSAPHRDRIFRADPVVEAREGNVESLRIGEQRVIADRYIFAAGEGNEKLLDGTGLSVPMQRRPLHQVMVKGSSLPRVYAHAVSLSAGAKPRITISTHSAGDGENVWYLGGNLAETGVDLTEREQCAFARSELEELFPWIDWQSVAWRSFLIDRAEPRQKDRARPDSPFVRATGNILVCWPTKLTLVPLMADEIVSLIDVAPDGAASEILPELPHPAVGRPPWHAGF